jgi:hypothetical protein
VICQALLVEVSTYTIEALEDSELLLLTYPCKRRLDEATTCFERYQEYYCRMLLSLCKEELMAH